MKGKKCERLIILLLILLIYSCSKNKEESQKNEAKNPVITTVNSQSEEKKKTSSSEANMENIISEIKKEKESTDKDKTLTIKEEDIDEDERGGIRTYYYKDNEIKKIVDENFGEDGKNYQEYYIKDNKIYFSYEVYTLYNAPLFVSKKVAASEGLKEHFDPSKSITEEKRYYFNKDEKLVVYINEKGKVTKNVQNLDIVEKEFRNKLSFNLN